MNVSKDPIQPSPELLPNNAFVTPAKTVLDLAYVAPALQLDTLPHPADSKDTVPHRYTGRAPFARKKFAVRNILAGKALPPYRTVEDRVIQSQPEVSPQDKKTVLHLICEMGDFANLDWRHAQKIAAVALWKPPEDMLLEVVIHPFDRTLLGQGVRGGSNWTEICKSQVIFQFPPDEPDSTRIEKVIAAYKDLKSGKPAHPDINGIYAIGLEDPILQITQCVQKIREEESANGVNPTIAVLTTLSYDADFNKQKVPIHQEGYRIALLGGKTENFTTADIPL